MVVVDLGLCCPQKRRCFGGRNFVGAGGNGNDQLYHFCRRRFSRNGRLENSLFIDQQGMSEANIKAAPNGIPSGYFHPNHARNLGNQDAPIDDRSVKPFCAAKLSIPVQGVVVS